MNVIRWARVHWDRAGAGALIALGGLCILVGWNRIGSEALTAQQVPYLISGGIGGLFFLGVGAMLWLSADLRDEWRKLDAIEQHLAERPGGTSGDVTGDEDDDPFAAADRTSRSAAGANGGGRRETEPEPVGVGLGRRTPLRAERSPE